MLLTYIHTILWTELLTFIKLLEALSYISGESNDIFHSIMFPNG